MHNTTMTINPGVANTLQEKKASGIPAPEPQ